MVIRDGGAVYGDAVPDAEVIDGSGLLVAPGFVDLQVNGGGEVDLAASRSNCGSSARGCGTRAWARSYRRSCARRPKCAIGPAVRSSRATRWMARRGTPRVAPRGPVPQPGSCRGGRRGVGRADHRRRRGAARRALGPTRSRWPPSCPARWKLVDELVGRSIVVAIGHTEASTACAQSAVDHGARLVTHLFNVMPGLHHREPGPVGVALGDDRVVASMIVDGVHVDPLAVRVAWRGLRS